MKNGMFTIYTSLLKKIVLKRFDLIPVPASKRGMSYIINGLIRIQ